MVRRWALVVLGFLSLVSADLSAELTVVHGSGDTRSIAPLLEVFAADEPPVPRADAHRPNLGAADLYRLLPIRSPGLAPGKVEQRPIAPQFAFVKTPSWDQADEDTRQVYRDHIAALPGILAREGLGIRAVAAED